MLRTKKDLKEYLKEDEKYYKKNIKLLVRDRLTCEHLTLIWKYIKFLRYEEYFLNNKRRILKLLCTRRKNILGNKLGFYILPNSIDKGLTICHHGNIIINGSAIIGKNCKFHGDNCVGNDGKTKKAPVLGNNVDVGIGAKILGDIIIADSVKIGANAVVVKSCYTKGATLVGIPAKELKKNG